MKQVLRTTLASLFVMGVAACNVIPEPEQVRVYPLVTGPVTPANHMFEGTIRVNEPTALSALDTARLAIYQDDGRQAYWQGIRLQDRVPLVIQDQLLQALQQSGVAQHVITDSSGAGYQMELQTHIEAFGVQTAAQPSTATVVLRAQLRSAGARQVVASRRFSVQIPVESDQVSGQLAALSRSLQVVQQELIEWLEQNF